MMQEGDLMEVFPQIQVPDAVCCTLGVICAVASAVSTVVGMLLQKDGLASENRFRFYLGMLIFTVMKPATQIVALYLAPISLVAPLASVAIGLNAAIVPYFQQESLGRWDLAGSAILMLGCVGTTLAGAHSSPSWSYAELVTLGAESIQLTSGLALLMLSLIAILLVAKWRGREKQLSIVAVALIPSAASALNNVAIKVLLQAVFSAPLPSLLVMFVCVGASAFLQVWSTTQGLKLFDMLRFVPIQVALQIFLTTAYGLVFFKEVPDHPRIFTICAASIVAGVLITLVQHKENQGLALPTKVHDRYTVLEDEIRGS
eukprot:gnl/MRDRNA2_/MRDRNA2_160567_c0_seq1.p1 gnl/MRDRNA2_/MRDRNA2_160567_c0~~gnl/MRDRNA2_/MRDRNA2_160567_c0_seq1.p1  ORF type:complete len:316 (+),score=38.62 gnl/MRDRNA2_/MRDRNA2_160567_c0_seq1:82-1029(+)